MADRIVTPKICAVEGCDNPCHGHGFCLRHYGRWRRNGDPLAGRTAPGSLLQWIKAHSSHNGDSCLIWPFGKFPDGYGQISYEGKSHRASRMMCRVAHGEPEDSSMVAAHSCGNGHKGCVNPQHVYWATYTENVHDSMGHGTWAHGTRVNTSKLTEDNVKEIRSLFGKMSGADIARKFGVTPQAICLIKKGKNWSWLE